MQKVGFNRDRLGDTGRRRTSVRAGHWTKMQVEESPWLIPTAGARPPGRYEEDQPAEIWVTEARSRPGSVGRPWHRGSPRRSH